MFDIFSLVHALCAVTYVRCSWHISHSSVDLGDLTRALFSILGESTIPQSSIGLVMFHSFFRLLLVQVKRFDILWEPIPRICANDSKTCIVSAIKNGVRNILVVYRSCLIITKQLLLDGHT